ncbi:hypothetical protein [Franconibacter pulveris]|uniref:hypothetical protein n=1 Tax=Franconibacter pulveris TaxID=435910 RepID=UPI00128EE66D|nr:hypothetical protein [Franconibacter pulveris]
MAKTTEEDVRATPELRKPRFLNVAASNSIIIPQRKSGMAIREKVDIGVQAPAAEKNSIACFSLFSYNIPFKLPEQVGIRCRYFYQGKQAWQATEIFKTVAKQILDNKKPARGGFIAYRNASLLRSLPSSLS